MIITDLQDVLYNYEQDARVSEKSVPEIFIKQPDGCIFDIVVTRNNKGDVLICQGNLKYFPFSATSLSIL
jgi:hypothetical protein